MNVKLEPSDGEEFQKLELSGSFFSTSTPNPSRGKNEVKEEIPQIIEHDPTLAASPGLQTAILVDNDGKQILLPLLFDEKSRCDSEIFRKTCARMAKGRRIESLFPTVVSQKQNPGSSLSSAPVFQNLPSNNSKFVDTGSRENITTESDKNYVIEKPVAKKIYSNRTETNVFEPAILLLKQFCKKAEQEKFHLEEKERGVPENHSSLTQIQTNEPTNLCSQFHGRKEDQYLDSCGTMGIGEDNTQYGEQTKNLTQSLNASLHKHTASSKRISKQSRNNIQEPADLLYRQFCGRQENEPNLSDSDAVTSMEAEEPEQTKKLTQSVFNSLSKHTASLKRISKLSHNNIQDPTDLLYSQFCGRQENEPNLSVSNAGTSVEAGESATQPEELNDPSMPVVNILRSFGILPNKKTDSQLMTPPSVIRKRRFDLDNQYPIGRKLRWGPKKFAGKKLGRTLVNQMSRIVDDDVERPDSNHLTGSWIKTPTNLTVQNKETDLAVQYVVGNKLKFGVNVTLDCTPSLPAGEMMRGGTSGSIMHNSKASDRTIISGTETFRPGDFVIGKGSKNSHLKCPVCQKEFASLNSFQNHVQEAPAETFYRCDECGEFFHDIKNLERHINSHKNNSKVVLESIFCSFKVKAMVHCKQTSFLCKKCKRYISCEASYFVSHLNDTRYEWMGCDPIAKFCIRCRYCTHKASNRLGLKYHVMNKHRKRKMKKSSEKKIVCEVCGAEFSTTRGLNIHAKSCLVRKKGKSRELRRLIP